jgi:predicted SAM-dependent methyltransferase
MKLNIGSGNKIMKGYINLDIAKLKNVDVVHDLNIYPYPFKDNTFEEVYADNVMEHLDDIIKPVEEIHRISKNNAIIKIIVPYSPSIWAFCDPTHKQFYTYFTFDYFTEDSTLNYYSKARFEIIKKTIRFNSYLSFLNRLVNLTKKTQGIYNMFFNGICPAMFLDFELRVIKK